MKKNKQPALKIAAADAAHVLHSLIAEGKITVRDVTTALKRRKALIRDLRKRLAALEAGAIVKIKAVAREGGGKRRPRKLSAATRAKYRAQGRYMAAVRRLPKAARAKVRAIRAKAGVRAAVAAARQLRKR